MHSVYWPENLGLRAVAYAIFSLGIALVAAAIILAFRTKSGVQATVAMVLGVVCSLAGAGFLASIEAPGGVKASVQQVEQKVNDATQGISQALAPINLGLQNLKDALAQQDQFNKKVSDRIDSLSNSLAPTTPKLSQPDLYATSASTKANGAFTILIFYRDTGTTTQRRCSRDLRQPAFRRLQ